MKYLTIGKMGVNAITLPFNSFWFMIADELVCLIYWGSGLGNQDKAMDKYW